MTLHRKEDFKVDRRRNYYKVVYREGENKFQPPIYCDSSNKIEMGKWVDEYDFREWDHKGANKIDTCGAKGFLDYLYGFHCYTSLKDAINSKWNKPQRSIVKAKIRDVRETGRSEQGTKIVVAGEMKITGVVEEAIRDYVL